MRAMLCIIMALPIFSYVRTNSNARNKKASRDSLCIFYYAIRSACKSSVTSIIREESAAFAAESSSVLKKLE